MTGERGDAFTRTLDIELAYNGEPFSGFARQKDVHETVQENLEVALEVLFKRVVETTCAGRTDAGVHARCQHVSFDVTEEEFGSIDLSRMRISLNALTDRAISVKSLSGREYGWSARFDAVSREYRYFICTQTFPPIFLDGFSWHLPEPLDVDAMYRSSRCLIGEHDFKSFCKAASAVDKPTCRNVSAIEFAHECIMGEDALVITVCGNAFLHSMVRTMVGSLVAVGQHKQPEEWIGEALAACDRAAAGQTAPAQGLVLWSVTY
ncbi:MAG: tRNA pseudouridine(38-40) synthase TruA [Eggerthellaceae bacterium]|nr:tRNA pseudouridine(38-40) synthase TruA [Eggerthellaceae bacterium]